MDDKLREYLVTAASMKITSDNADFEVTYYAGSNVNDAYDMGVDHGNTFFARLLLAKFGGPIGI